MTSDLTGALDTLWINHSYFHLSPQIIHIPSSNLSPFSASWWSCLIIENIKTICGECLNFRQSSLHTFSLASFLFKLKWCPIRVNSTNCTLGLSLFSSRTWCFQSSPVKFLNLKMRLDFFVLHSSNVKKKCKLSFMSKQVVGLKKFFFLMLQLW